MTEPSLKTQDDLKIRVAEEPVEANAVRSVPAKASPNESAPESKTVSSVETVLPKSKANDPDDLMDVILNPHAPEQEWLSACNELEKHNRRNERKAATKEPINKLDFGKSLERQMS